MVAFDEIDHDLHPNHKLKLERKETPYRCDGCEELGFHSRYACEPCNFHLHVPCADPRPFPSNRFFEDCNFKFLKTGLPGRVCDACGMDAKGFLYHCDACGKDLHPCCANLQPVLEGVHPKLELRKEMYSKCYCCGRKKVNKISTWGYVSACKTYSLHIWCVKELALNNWMKQGCCSSDDGKASSEGQGESPGEGESEGRALAIRTPTLQLDRVGKNKGATGGKLAKMKNTIRIAIAFLVAAILGDPTAIVAGLIASLISH